MRIVFGLCLPRVGLRSDEIKGAATEKRPSTKKIWSRGFVQQFF